MGWVAREHLWGHKLGCTTTEDSYRLENSDWDCTYYGLIKNEGTRVLTRLYIDFSDAQGQLTLQSVVNTG